MKKLAKLFTSLAIMGAFVLTPAAALAEDVPVVEVAPTDTTTTTTTPTTTSDTTTTTSTAGIPDAGIAPAPSKLTQNLLVFIVGGSVGAAIGLGIIYLKKSSQQTN